VKDEEMGVACADSVTCNTCNGAGYDRMDAMLCCSVIPDCGTCGGHGRIPRKQKRSPGLLAQLLGKLLKTTESEKPV